MSVIFILNLFLSWTEIQLGPLIKSEVTVFKVCRFIEVTATSNL